MIILNYVKKKNLDGSVVLKISGFRQNNITILLDGLKSPQDLMKLPLNVEKFSSYRYLKLQKKC